MKYHNNGFTETQSRILSTYSQPISHKQELLLQDLGTEVSAEIYFNSNSNSNLNKNLNENMNRFRSCIGTENLWAEPRLNPSRPTAVSEEEEGRKSVFDGFGDIIEPLQKETYGYVRLNRDALYTHIHVQVNDIRDEGKIQRAKIYYSLRRDTDNKFTTFLASSLTSSKYELNRGMKKKRDTVQNLVQTLFERQPNSLIGRLHYKAPKTIKTSNFHRKLLTSSVCSLYNTDDIWYTDLLLMGEIITIPLITPRNAKQSKFYDLVGEYKTEMTEFNDDEEFE